MKRCPTCNRVESDDALNFCRVDGAKLVSTQSFAETEESGETRLFGATPGTIHTSQPLTTTSRIRQATRSPRRSVNSLAVMPLRNDSGDAEMEYFSDGITESIINALSHSPRLRVVPRSTVFRYKHADIDPQHAGHELGVRAIVTGRVRQTSDRLVIAVELVDVERQSQLWGEHYNRKLAEVFDVQEEIAREIAEKLRLRLTRTEKTHLTRRQTESTAAYQAYLQGRFHWYKRSLDGLKLSAEYFKQALALDPGYALAHAGLADSYAILGIAEYGIMSPLEAMPLAKAAAMKALKIDKTLAEAQTTLAHVYAFYDWDWPAAEKAFKRAIKLNPQYALAHHWYALYLAAMERHDEAIASERRAQEIEPLSLIINKNVGTILFYAGQLESSIEQYQRTLELEANFARTHFYLGVAYVLKQQYAEAIREYEQALQLSGGEGAVLKGLLAHAHALAGNHDTALKILKEMKAQRDKQYVPAFNIALVYVGLGQLDDAFAWLAKAFKERSSWLVSLKIEPMLNVLHPDPRFDEMVERIGLPE
jgi:TolB-like protein